MSKAAHKHLDQQNSPENLAIENGSRRNNHAAKIGIFIKNYAIWYRLLHSAAFRRVNSLRGKMRSYSRGGRAEHSSRD